MVERVNFGTMGFNNQMVGDFEEIQQMPAYTPPPPRYNEGIETLVNTYSPPSDLQQQAAAQRLRASQVGLPAQNLANQQAAAFQNLLVNAGVIADPNPPVCKIFLPITVITGKIFSKAFLSPPTNIVIFPVAAL